MVHQVCGEALVTNAAHVQRRVAVDVFQALLDPAHQILADVKQHADFAVAAVEQRPVQVFGGAFAGGQQALQHQAGARAFHQLVGSAGVGERMQNQRRQRFGLLVSFSLGCFRWAPKYARLSALGKQYFGLNCLGPAKHLH